LVGLAGIVLGIAAGTAMILIRKKPKIRFIPVAAVLLSAVLGITLSATVKSGKTNEYRLYDGYILWNADSYRRLSSSGIYDPEQVDIEDTYDVYSFINKETIDIIKRYPVEGTGPEQLVYPQLYTSGFLSVNAKTEDIIDQNKGTFDKCYNEYLYTAATRGIPSLIFLAAVLIGVIFIGSKKLRKNESDVSVGFFMLALCGMLVFMIGCSNIAFSPVFWACAGLACAKIAPEKKYARRAARRAAAAEKKAEGKPAEEEKAE
jgi:O-antigen ligase